MIWSHRNSWGAMRQKMAIFNDGNSSCRVQMFFRSFHFIFRKKWTAGGDASENGDFQTRKQRLQGTIFFRSFHFIFRKKWTAELENRLCLMIMMMMMMMMMMMISCWGWWCSFSNRYNDDVVMMMQVYRPFPFWNRSSLSTHFVKWYSSNFLSFGIEGLM